MNSQSFEGKLEYIVTTNIFGGSLINGISKKTLIENLKKQDGLPDYNLFGSSCIDVPQEALEAVVAHRLNVQSKKDPQFWDNHLSFYDANKYGSHMLAPNDWYNDLLGGRFNNFVESINSDLKTNPLQVRKMPVTTVVVGPIEELYKKK